MAEEEMKHDKKEEIKPDALLKAIAEEPEGKDPPLADIPVTKKNIGKFIGETHRRPLPKGIIFGIIGVAVLFVAGSVVSYQIAKRQLADRITKGAGAVQAGINDLENMDLESAAKDFSSVGTGFPAGLNGFLSLFMGGNGSAFGSFADLSGKLSQISTGFNNLINDSFTFAASGKGSELIADLTTIRNTLGAIDADGSSLTGAAASLGFGSDFNTNLYLPMAESIKNADNFLDTFIPWFSSEVPHHVLVLLENPSEMRPGGGFLGSYADITLAGGNVLGISVRDIADVDAAFSQNIVPPKPLQPEVTRFRPADANWFFDFPTTATETIQYFQGSGFYAANSTTFEAVIAITPKVVSDILSVTGPVTIGKGSASTTFTADNLVVEIQSIVQNGQAQSATYPKQVLADLSQAVFTKLQSSTPDQKQALLQMAQNWMAEKDVMMYFEDPAMESFATSYGVSGAMYELPFNFNGDYLAIANADINSDKSELYVRQKVNFETQINDDGSADDHLVIDRVHTGNKSPYWWYQTMNQDYLQVFVPLASALSDASGGTAKKITAPVDYYGNGYSTDPFVAAEASTTQTYFDYPSMTTHDEFGKEVFSTWAVTPKGGSTEIKLDYSHHLYAPPSDGQKYQFIFEKQPGAVGDYTFDIYAPLGYVFEETGIASYEYTTNDPPARLIVNLTLKKLQ